jgi:hypothetical protein
MRAVHRTEALAGLALDSAPPLRGYSRVRARPEAEVLLATAGGDPLLARWQVGLGQVGAWTSDLASRWSAELARWPSFSKMWGQLARAAMRRGAANHFPIRAHLEGDRVVAHIDALAADDHPMSGLAGTLEVLEASSEAGQVPGGGVAPAGAAPTTTDAAPTKLSTRMAEPTPGVYEAEVPVRGPGALLLAARFTDAAGALVAEAHGRLAVPFARELMPEAAPTPESAANSGAALLDALAARTRGAIVDAPAAVLDAGADRVVAAGSLQTPLLLGAILLFLADLALRRVRFPRS